MPDVPDWFLSAAGASGRNCLGITRLDFRTIYLGLRRRYQEALEYFELPLRISAYPLTTTGSNGLVAKHAAAKSARLRALTRNVTMSPKTDPIGNMKKDPDDAQA
ncbi:hypothetical protein [Bradyrhizobium icense]|uniref:hypothetical protein n=1 Tax=Bradyrhizobium icense TaxID=1274631 RepID=UPI0012EA7B64|nr:hypothetical protein [Bradyrhizobium icense]